MTEQITVITPTTGNPNSLNRLMGSLALQGVPYMHLLLWDDARHPDALDPYSYELENVTSIVLKGRFINGVAAGSALRAVGLMAANTKYVTFADDDVWFDEGHLNLLLDTINGKEWAYTFRKIWAPSGECLGEDRFESVGDETKLPYQLIDNSSMMFTRVFGASAACLYRETNDYNDDRLMYAFLKMYGGSYGKTDVATVNQVCPARLVEFFRQGCTPCK